MLSSLLPILPSLGLLLIIVLGYFVFKQKVHEYNQKFTSMFSLLSAMTDEIQKLKNGKTFQQIEIDDNEVEDSEYESEEDEDEYHNEEDNSDHEDDDDEDDEEHDDDDDDDDDELQSVNLEDEQNQENNVHSNEIQSADIHEEVNAKEIKISENDLDYDSMPLKELKALAKDRGLGMGEKLKKSELVNLLVESSLKIE